MAIQNRRGAYTDFDPTKMVAGEFAVVQSNDPNATDGKSLYIAFAAGDVKRLATYEDMEESVLDSIGDLDDLETTTKSSLVDAINELAEKPSIYYGYTTTGSSTRDKVVNCPDFVATNGAFIAVSFSQKNNVTNARLNVNDTGAYQIFSVTNTQDTSWLSSVGVYLFRYSTASGGRYHLIGACERIPSDITPVMNGTASAGSSLEYSRSDHVHPTDTSRASQADMDVVEQDITDIKADLSDIEEQISGGGMGVSDDLKLALLQIASKVAYIDDDGQDYYDALYDALYPPANLVSISAVYTQSGTVYDTDSLDDLKTDLVVTATYDDSTTETVTNYTLSGTLEEGTSTITVTYGGKTTTFSVTVSHASHNYIYNWDFTQSLEDSVQGATLTLAGNATRDSSGLHFTSASDYVELTGLNSIGNCFEIDVAEYDRKGTNHGRLFTIYQSGVASSGFIYHSTGVWAIYSKADSAWIDTSLSADALDGKTVTVKLLENELQSNKNWMYVYLDGDALCDGRMDGTTTNNAYLGSNNQNVAYDMTITGLRVYQEV